MDSTEHIPSWAEMNVWVNSVCVSVFTCLCVCCIADQFSGRVSVLGAWYIILLARQDCRKMYQPRSYNNATKLYMASFEVADLMCGSKFVNSFFRTGMISETGMLIEKIHDLWKFLYHSTLFVIAKRTLKKPFCFMNVDTQKHWFIWSTFKFEDHSVRICITSWHTQVDKCNAKCTCLRKVHILSRRITLIKCRSTILCKIN